jgi:formylglycine-generating enzyme required for sulfatase activity
MATLVLAMVFAAVNAFGQSRNPPPGKAKKSGAGFAQRKIDGMAWIPGGTFLMGSPAGEGADNEHPQHRVTVRGFYMDTTEVTQEQYERFMGDNAHCDDGTCWQWDPDNGNSVRGILQDQFRSPDKPEVCVSWYDAKAYCEKAGKRLPTEAEWEYAARAGSTAKYYWGNKMDGDYCWYNQNSMNMTNPAGQKRPNAFGLYDMLGNVWEWCADVYDDGYAKGRPAKNPPGPSRGQYRALRGGSWFDFGRDCRCATRVSNYPYSCSRLIGFRCARSR